MGTFAVACRVSNVVDRTRSAELPQLLVDTGSEYTWIPAKVLDQLSIDREKKDLEGLNLTVDSQLKKLVAASPLPAA